MSEKKITNPITARKPKSAAGIILTTVVTDASHGDVNTQPKAGILGVDHVGIVVPDRQQALDFFINVLGFTPVTTLGPVTLDAGWKDENAINAATGAITYTMLKSGTGASIELLTYQNSLGSKEHPAGDDVGASHIAFYTTDIYSAVSHLEAAGVKFIGEPSLILSGDTAGEMWVYFLTPWGSTIELVSYPDGMGYEKNSPKTLLWSPKNAVRKVGANAAAAISGDEGKSIADRHLMLWSERESSKRLQIMDKIYSEDIVMVDPHLIATGHAQVDDFIQNLHQANPDFLFSAAQPVDAHHDIVRLYWQAGPATKPDLVTGMDLLFIEKGKVQKLYVFVDGTE